MLVEAFFFISLYCLLLFEHSFAKNNSNECSRWVSQHVFASKEVHYFNLSNLFIEIDDLEQLNVTHYCPKIDNKTNTLKIYATHKLLLDNDVDLRALINFFTFSDRSTASLLFQNVRGFNQITTKVKQEGRAYENSIQIVLNSVNLAFYRNGTLLRDSDCLKTNFDAAYGRSFFGSLQSLVMPDNVFYKQKICPYVFLQSRLQQVSFGQITNSLLFKNRLEFLSINQTGTFDMSLTDLIILELSLAFERITLRLVDRFVFKDIRYLMLTGAPQGIESDFFSNFRRLIFASVRIENMKEFYHSGTKWITMLNSHVRVDLSDKLECERKAHLALRLELHEAKCVLKRAYAYPDADICLFSEFPHSSLVFPIIVYERDIECTCTLVWLIQYYSLYLNQAQSSYSDYVYLNAVYSFFNFTARHYCQNEFVALFDSCNFTDKFLKCHVLETVTTQSSGSDSDISLLFILKWIQYALEVYFRPICCFVAIVTNVLTIKVIRNRRHQRCVCVCNSEYHFRGKKSHRVLFKNIIYAL